MVLPKYVGIFLTPASRRALLKEFPPIHENVSADHVTLSYDPDAEALARFVPGTIVKFRVRGYVEDDKGQAITVELPAPYDALAERDPHVTISMADGVKGVYSNTIIPRAKPTTAYTYTGIVDWDKRRAPVRTRRFPMARRVAARYRTADLSPPLGYPGGACHVVDRIDDADPPGEGALIDMVEDGHDLTNPEAARVYERHVERGAWKFRKMLLGPHAQYRMDLRGITVPEVRLALKRFFRAWNDARSEGDTFWDEEMARARPIDWIDKRQHLQVSFRMHGRDTIKIITVFRPGDQDPAATDC